MWMVLLLGLQGLMLWECGIKSSIVRFFGIAITKEFWGLGIGKSLMEACIECAREAGYLQLELEVVAENERAVEMYRRAGFIEYGRNPKAFRLRTGEYQELIDMRLELK